MKALSSPVLNLVYRSGVHEIDGEHPNESLRVIFGALNDIAAVVPVARGGLNQDGFANACSLHALNHLVAVYRTLLRPIGLFATHGGKGRKLRGVVGDDVAMGVHNVFYRSGHVGEVELKIKEAIGMGFKCP